MDWQTSPSLRKIGPQPWWKRPTGEVCPHGREIFLVVGTHVRNNCDSDFSQGGNGYAYPNFIPEDEIWVDASTPADEIPLVAFHECHEAEDMRRGMTYDKAHDRAKKLEDQFRRLLMPGEPTSKGRP